MYNLDYKSLGFIDADILTLLDKIEIEEGRAGCINYFVSTLNKVIRKKTSLVCEGDMSSGVIFFKSPSTKRNDHASSFEKICNTIERPCDKIIAEIKNVYSVKRTFSLLCFCFKKIVKNLSSIADAYFWAKLNGYILALDFLNDIKDYNFETVNLGVVYYDVSWWDYIFVQYLKSKNIRTATLQHAAFISPREVSVPSFEFKGIELSNSTSDYFLAWNDFTKDEAVKSGVPKDKVRVLGIPKYAFFQPQKTKVDKKKIFGVVLNAYSFDNLNKQLLEYANYLSEKYNYKFFLKYHPQYEEFIYDELADERFFLGHLDLNTSINDYIEKVDFTLLGNSSVFIELVFLKHKVFRLQAGEYDKFAGIDINSFYDKDSLEKLIENPDHSSSINLFSYLCCTQEPERNYREFFSEFLNS